MRAVTLACLVACSGPTAPPKPQSPAGVDYTALCHAIAGDIELLRRQYPQLAEYRAVDALRRDCTIDFGWHTHRAAQTGGWSAGVPTPDADGIWFYIGIYDPNGPDAQSQINTQPVVPNWWLGDRKVTFLLLEGAHTHSVASELHAILEHRGMEVRGR
jgi:hypothetical protein